MWELTGNYEILKVVFSGHLWNYSIWYFWTGFKFGNEM